MKFKVERNKFQTLLDPCVTPALEAPGDSAEPGDRFQGFKISRFQIFKSELRNVKNENLLKVLFEDIKRPSFARPRILRFNHGAF